jgi:hypothetical protein
MKRSFIAALLCLMVTFSYSQDTSAVIKDSGFISHTDTSLRILNLNPVISLHVDSSLNYQFNINRSGGNYFWYLINSPVGLKINKDNGLLSFKAAKSYFLSGRLKYDVNYKIVLGVENISNPQDRVDTSFSLVFYNLEILPSKVKPAVSSTILADEGDVIKFKVLCEAGSFPIDRILTFTSRSINNYTAVQRCGDEFLWTPDHNFVKETDSGKVKIVNVFFVGSTKFQKDTATVRVIVKDALNYAVATQEYNLVVKNVQRYILQLKYTFLQLDKKLKRTKSTRTTFDLTSATTSLTGTVLSTSSSPETVKTSKILPSIGLALVPIKEASVPNKPIDQNQAASIRSSIKRMEYMLTDNMLVGERDWDITKKTGKLKDELKQTQVQLIDVPVEITNDLSEEELNRYFNSEKVNKKYRLKRT